MLPSQNGIDFLIHLGTGGRQQAAGGDGRRVRRTTAEEVGGSIQPRLRTTEAKVSQQAATVLWNTLNWLMVWFHPYCTRTRTWLAYFGQFQQKSGTFGTSQARFGYVSCQPGPA